MKRLEMFEFRAGWGYSESDIANNANERIKQLTETGITNIDLSVVPTGKGVMVVLIYDRSKDDDEIDEMRRLLDDKN